MTDSEPGTAGLSPETLREVWAAAKATGHAGDAELFAPCPRGCTIPRDIHRHYQRAPGDYYHLREPVPCCGREWARPDELFVLDQCEWCRQDGKPLPAAVLIYPRYTLYRDRSRRRSR